MISSPRNISLNKYSRFLQYIFIIFIIVKIIFIIVQNILNTRFNFIDDIYGISQRSCIMEKIY